MRAHSSASAHLLAAFRSSCLQEDTPCPMADSLPTEDSRFLTAGTRFPTADSHFPKPDSRQARPVSLPASRAAPAGDTVAPPEPPLHPAPTAVASQVPSNQPADSSTDYAHPRPSVALHLPAPLSPPSSSPARCRSPRRLFVPCARRDRQLDVRLKREPRHLRLLGQRYRRVCRHHMDRRPHHCRGTRTHRPRVRSIVLAHRAIARRRPVEIRDRYAAAPSDCAGMSFPDASSKSMYTARHCPIAT